MFNPIIIAAIIIQSVVTKASRKAGAIVGFVITIGILLWGISLYGEGDQIALFGIPISEPIFYIACLVWFGFDTMEFVAAQKRETETEALSTKKAQAQIPGFALFFLWVTTNVLANISWSMLYPLFNQLSPSVATIVLSLSGGLIAGLLQWFLLIMILPNTNRWRLALWIPASMVGWAIIYIIVTFVKIPSGMTILVSIIRGGTLGVLQWFVLQKYSKKAFWLIPSNIIDILAVSFLPRYIFENISISNLTIGNIIIGLIASIATSVVIVYISKEATRLDNLETERIPESI